MKEKLLQVISGDGTGGLLISALSLAMPIVTFAQIGNIAPPAPVVPQFTNLGGIYGFICSVIVSWLFFLLLAVAVIFIILAAFKYLTASGDAEKVKAASHQLIYAVVAVVVALLARSLPLLIQSILSAGVTTPVC